MITGYNTDVEYDGVTYHVQTEDKGLQTPMILTLLYVGGAILASKRTPYDDLVASGFNEDVLRKRLERQHKLICAAVHAGRIEDLKRMGEREPPLPQKDAAPSPPEPQPETVTQPTEAAINIGADEEGFTVKLVEEPDLRGGRSIALKLVVGRVTDGRLDPVEGARVKVTTLGTAFSPTSVTSLTDEKGVADFSVSLPVFESGRAAILVKAEANGETAELRRIILPS
ncbi:MAG TPA: hypothetical protein VNG71_03725 [Pyrinomonadaceae bacterium]|nr:hypothetical protein [Pyrinomonadaceae bacterium]